MGTGFYRGSLCIVRLRSCDKHSWTTITLYYLSSEAHHQVHPSSHPHHVSQERYVSTKLPLCIFLTLPDSFPASEAFDLINAALSSSDAERKDAIKKGGAIFAFTLKNKSGETASWYIDLKESGTVGKGEAPEGKKAAGK